MNKQLISFTLGILMLASLTMAMPYGMTYAQMNFNGLQNAVNVANVNASTQLQKNINMLNYTNQVVLNSLNNLTLETTEGKDVVVSGFQTARLFGFIPLQHRYTFTISPEGQLMQNKNMFSFLWSNEINTTDAISPFFYTNEYSR